MTLLGRVRFSRAYYHCPRCRAGHRPRDARLGLGGSDLSRGAAEAVALAGTLSSFADAVTRTLPKPAGLRVGESTVERTTERVGRDVGEGPAGAALLDRRLHGPAGTWEWSPDADGEAVAYVSADATGVGMQGPGAGAAEGPMASVGMVWNAGQPGQVRYVCGLDGGLAALGQPLRSQAAQVGMGRAARWVAVPDGGAGIGDWLRSNFPRVEAVVPDFFHAAEYLGEWAKALHPDDEAEAGRVAGEWCHRLKHEGGAAVLADLRRVDVSGRSEAVREAHRGLLVYFANQAHRMDDPAYRARGWLIGSGPVEAARKPVVGQRLKGSGMRWGEAGADAVCHLRAPFRSEKGRWDAYWASLAALLCCDPTVSRRGA